MNFQVMRNRLDTWRFLDRPPGNVEPGQALLRIDAFGFSANNVTYASFGEPLGYWSYFPTGDEAWGHIPVWGIATVAKSRSALVREGNRYYGFLPPAASLLVAPDRANESGFVDAMPHRAGLPATYNRYTALDGTPGFEPARQDAYMVLRPVFFLSFMMDDYLRELGCAGAKRVLVSSASSKAALGLARLVSAQADFEVIGLTSARNIESLGRLGAYSRLLPYDAIGSLPPCDSVYVDMSGNSGVRSAVHRHLQDRLKLSVSAGFTHWNAPKPAEPLPGPEPVFFFTPDRILKRTQDWGRAGLDERFSAAWHPFVRWTEGWLSIQRSAGLAALEQVYPSVLEGSENFSTARVVTP